MAQAASQAAPGEWVTNDKILLSRAGLAEMDLVVAGVAEVGRILSMTR